MESRLEKLPDEILINIVRFMEFKDAVKTSVVSKTFENLFTYHTRLYFDGHSRNLVDSNRFESEEKLFLDLVNRVLESYGESFMESFGIRFPLDSNNQGIINKWVSFVLSKGVTTLELDFSVKNYYSTISYEFPCYSFPYECQFRLLKSLHIKRVNICIESLLSICTVLERLHVEDITYVDDHPHFSSQSLKFLAIKATGPFAYSAMEFKFQVPNLVEASFGGDFCERLFDDGFSHISITSLSCQLSKLYLECKFTPLDSLSDVPIFEKVKELTLRINILSLDYRLFLDLLTTLFKACPSLQTIILETDWLKQNNDESIITDTNNSDAELELSSDSDEQSSEGSAPEECLKFEYDDFDPAVIPNLQSLEWRGAFRSNIDNDVLVALHIVKNATKLEKMVFDPRSSFNSPPSGGGTVDEVENISRETARLLTAVIPKHIKIVIL